MSSSATTPSTASAATPNPSSSISSTSTTAHAHAHTHAHTPAVGPDGPDSLSPLEQQLLDEYARLAANMNRLSTSLAHLADAPSASILDSLRLLERKIGPVFTLLKASVYSIVLQQQILGEEGGGEGRGGEVR